MKYKEFNISYTEKVVDLLNICLKTQNITKSSFLWKHFDEYFSGKSIGMIAIDNNKICAFVCFTPVIIANNNNIYKNFYSCAIQATHPNYRRKGIISDLTKIIERKINHNAEYIGFSNKNGIKIDRFSKKIGYTILSQMKTRYVLSLPYKKKFNIKQIYSLNIEKEIKSNYFSILKNNSYIN